MKKLIMFLCMVPLVVMAGWTVNVQPDNVLVSNPTATNHPANKQYVDDLLTGYSQIDPPVTNLGDCADVLNTGPAVGQLLRYDGTQWTNAAGFVWNTTTNADYLGDSFTARCDAAWHDLDLSTNRYGAALVPTNVTWVMIYMDILDGDTGSTFIIKRKGEVSDYKQAVWSSQAGTGRDRGTQTVPINPDRVMTFKGDAALTNAVTLGLGVAGWGY